MSERELTRRGVLPSLLAVPAGCSLCAQTNAGELANVLEMLPAARRKLTEDIYAGIAGTDRRALERITFRPRMMVNVTQLDLTLELFRDELFAPILVGPISHQQAFHPEGEIAMVRGAAAAKTAVILSSRSSRRLSDILAAAKTPVWFQVYPEAGVNATIAAARHAVQAGCTAVCLTVGVPYQKREAGNLKLDWTMVGRVRDSVKAPLLLKGIMSPDEARLAVSRGVDAVVVSNHGGMYTTGFADPTEMLPLVADAVGGKIPILVDGSFRRGTDILKALALGARAVLVARPAVWGLRRGRAEGSRNAADGTCPKHGAVRETGPEIGRSNLDQDTQPVDLGLRRQFGAGSGLFSCEDHGS
jgi:4-hydroxymandelate oxidase